MNLSKLVEWGLVRRVHKRGDRRDYYESLSDVWEMFTLVAAQRKRREIDPIVNTLRACREQLSPEALGAAAEDDAGRGTAAPRRRIAVVFDADGRPGAAVLRQPPRAARGGRSAGEARRAGGVTGSNDTARQDAAVNGRPTDLRRSLGHPITGQGRENGVRSFYLSK